ncbi:uncharacterized protein A1O9_01576 [Exophiala aquamarina CBS 119918]|uniref:Transcription factor domain-containing protein n=1 Tax=Exophiala aquamarina CBS 119918 TaxID=1182545 RepID=A0A072PW49_9EURO|nr:uncharacterized protein A1O9_01576 [Exophiala aquamarina CBS 119918]KEF63598.1 hypothetical protein A1O9_01576 [Exophiala aquamarina CBS 119918]
MDLGWHNLSPGDDQQPNSLTSLDQRKQRNVERTWLVLFVYDRSISLQTGKPRMIDRSSFLESVDTWYRSPLALPSDVLLCAFVSLRLLTSEVFELLEIQRAPSPQSPTHQIESLLKIIERQVKAWQEHWLRIAENGVSAIRDKSLWVVLTSNQLDAKLVTNF